MERKCEVLLEPLGVIWICRTTRVDDPEPARRWFLGSGDAVLPMYVEPAELADGDLRCRGWLMKLWVELGREMSSSISELGVWLPNDRLLGSLR